MAQRFIAGAAARLAPAARLSLLVNRFLPYETDLRQRCVAVREVAGGTRCTVLLTETPAPRAS